MIKPAQPGDRRAPVSVLPSRVAEIQPRRVNGDSEPASDNLCKSGGGRTMTCDERPEPRIPPIDPDLQDYDDRLGRSTVRGAPRDLLCRTAIQRQHNSHKHTLHHMTLWGIGIALLGGASLAKGCAQGLLVGAAGIILLVSALIKTRRVERDWARISETLAAPDVREEGS